MRCLYCNKELALLKRLTGGAEFCSDAHRKKYQEEFNDLALTRLMQAPPPPPAKPLTEPEPEIVPVPEPPPAAIAPTRTRGIAGSGPKLVTATSAPPKQAPAQAKAAPQPKAPQPKDPAIVSYLIEEPLSKGIEFVVAAGEPPILAAAKPELPLHAFQAVAGDYGFSHANAVTMHLAIERPVTPIRPRDGQVEVREFSRQAIAPVQPLQQDILTNDSALKSASGEAMEITNQPRPPADPPMIWQAGPQPAPTVDLALGDLSRLDFAVTGFGEDSPPAQPSRPTQPFTTAPAVPTIDPVAAAPSAPVPIVENLPAATPQAPVAAQVVAAQPQAAPIPEPVTTSLPITLQGVTAGAAKPATIISSGVATSIEPQVPASSALPLRPTMILAPRLQPVPAPSVTPTVTAKAPPTPTPLAEAPIPPSAPNPSPAPVANTSVVRPVRGPNGKSRRPEVRVVQTGTPGAPPPPQPQTTPVVPATAAKTVTPVKTAPPRPVAAEAPKEVVKSEPPKAAPRPEPVKPPKPEIDLNLPVLHNPEVSGPWAKLPTAAKAGIGAVLALGIVGLAYTLLNSNKAAATASVVPAAPTYQLGKQINSNGWIEDWAPAGSTRHITLLRGSQPYSDYRIEFQAQIQRKAIGWMYRGLNPRNYYVVKLEKLKNGIEPEVALVRYAVIDGESERRVEKVLPMKVRVDTTYKIRFDAVGSEFAVWVQDKKIDDWRDSRLGSGGVGLYSEGDEAAAVNGTVNVFELASAK